MLQKYRFEPSHILLVESIEVNPDMTYNEKPTLNHSMDIKKLSKKIIPLVNTFWMNHSGKEATWEREEDMRR